MIDNLNDLRESKELKSLRGVYRDRKATLIDELEEGQEESVDTDNLDSLSTLTA